MSDPTIINCTEGVWTLIGTAITTGFVRRPIDMGQFQFRWTYRDTGGAAPSDSDSTDGGNAQILFEETNNEELSFPSPADVYVRPRDGNDDNDATAKVSIALP